MFVAFVLVGAWLGSLTDSYVERLYIGVAFGALFVVMAYADYKISGSRETRDG